MKNDITHHRNSYLVFAALFIFFCTDIAKADDSTVYRWDGIFGGLNLGVTISNTDVAPTCIDDFGVINGAACQATPNQRLDGAGLIFGAQAGFNKQMGQFIWGAELDIQLTDHDGSVSDSGPFLFQNGTPVAFDNVFNASLELEQFASLRFKAGHVISDQEVIYATGGMAAGRYHAQTSLVSSFFNFAADEKETRWGWIAGAGYERALSPRMSFKLEALYYDLGQLETSAIEFGFTRGAVFDLDGVIIRGGVNWKLN